MNDVNSSLGANAPSCGSPAGCEPSSGHCTCQSGRDHDGSEFGPCEFCETTSFEERLKVPLLRSLVGFWSDVDEVRQRAGINIGASTTAWRALNDLVADGLAECSGSDLQYRLTDEGRAVRANTKDHSPSGEVG